MVPPKNVSQHATLSNTNASQHATPRYELIVARTMVSTTLAKAEQLKNVEIPPEFCQYGKVFSEKEAQ